MGFGTIAANTIMFIAVITVAAGFVMYFNMHTQDLTNSMNEQRGRLQEEIRTDITITSMSFSNDTSPHTTTVYVKNTGKVKLDMARTDIYINGYRLGQDNRTLSIEPDTSTGNPLIWDPKEIMKIEGYMDLSPGLHKVRIVTSNGISDEDIFSY